MWDSKKLLSMLEQLAREYEPLGEVTLYAMGGTAMTLLVCAHRPNGNASPQMFDPTPEEMDRLS